MPDACLASLNFVLNKTFGTFMVCVCMCACFACVCVCGWGVGGSRLCGILAAGVSPKQRKVECCALRWTGVSCTVRHEVIRDMKGPRVSSDMDMR